MEVLLLDRQAPELLHPVFQDRELLRLRHRDLVHPEWTPCSEVVPGIAPTLLGSGVSAGPLEPHGQRHVGVLMDRVDVSARTVRGHLVLLDREPRRPELHGPGRVRQREGQSIAGIGTRLPVSDAGGHDRQARKRSSHTSPPPCPNPHPADLPRLVRRAFRWLWIVADPGSPINVAPDRRRSGWLLGSPPCIQGG